MARPNEKVPIGWNAVRPRSRWELAARKALDSWAGGPEQNVTAAIEQGYRDGIATFAKFLEKHGQGELARALRKAEAGSQ